MTSVLPYLLQRYKGNVVLETNPKGVMLLGQDKRFKAVTQFDPFLFPQEEMNRETAEHWKFYWDELFKDYDILNFIGTLEGAGVMSEFETTDIPDNVKSANFYETHFQRAGIEMPKDFVAKEFIDFPSKMIDSVERWHWRFKDSFNMIVAIGGSTLQKVFPTWMPEFCKELIDSFPEMHIFLVGDNTCADGVWEYTRTHNYVNGASQYNLGFKQALLMTSYADYVLGGETGLLVGAGHFATPKTMLCATSSVEQCVKYHDNDFSLQSEAKCSPCYRTCYAAEKCKKESMFDTFPICTDEWDLDKLFNLIANQYRRKF